MVRVPLSGGKWPAQPTTRSDALLLRAAAKPRQSRVKQLAAARANAARELLDAVKGRGDARQDALELVELVQQREQRLEPSFICHYTQ